MKNRDWIYGILVIAAIICGYLAMKADGSDNFIRGYDFTSATGVVTGAELEDLITRAQFASTVFDPSNTNRLFDTDIFTGKQSGATWTLTIANGKILSAMLGANSVVTDKIANSAVEWRALNTNVQIAVSNTTPNYYNSLANISYASIGTNGYTTNNSAIANGVTNMGMNMVDVYGWSFIAGPGDRSQPTNATRYYGVTFTNIISFEIDQLGYCPTTTMPVSENSFSNNMLYTNYVYIHVFNTSATNYSIRAWSPQEISLRSYYYGWRWHVKGLIFSTTNL